MTIRFCSWNIWCGIHFPIVLELLKKAKPDIIALQEVVEDDDGENNLAERIAKALGYQWRFEFVSRYQKYGLDARWGEAIVSRFDIEESEVLELSTDPRHIALQADIRVGKKLVHVYSTHLTAPSTDELRNHQREEAIVLARLASKDNTIIAGDFNATPESDTIAVIRKRFIDADTKNLPTWCVYPDGKGKPNFDAVKDRYDYVFHTSDLEVSRLNTIRTSASDHLPVIAKLVI